MVKNQSIVNTTRQKSTMLFPLALSGTALVIASLSIAISVGAVSLPTSTVWGVLVNKLAPNTIDQEILALRKNTCLLRHASNYDITKHYLSHLWPYLAKIFNIYDFA